MNSGPDKSSLDNATERIAQLDKVLDEYEEKNGIFRTNFNPEALEYLNLTKSEMELMSSQDCAIARVLLEQYAFYIQKVLNKEISRAKWCQANIDIVYANQAVQHRIPGAFQSKDEIKGLVVAGNTYTKKLNQILIEAENRINRLNGIPEKISYMSNALRSLENIKSGR